MTEMLTDAETVVAGRALTNLKQFFGLKSVFSLFPAAGSYSSARRLMLATLNATLVGIKPDIDLGVCVNSI